MLEWASFAKFKDGTAADAVRAAERAMRAVSAVSQSLSLSLASASPLSAARTGGGERERETAPVTTAAAGPHRRSESAVAK